ncbi:hypothetical protein FB45DRAFT_841513 [Roridomyces roridus]|uniref:Uncharacterized protein n=1 Tax=Roridomyces roridus TaxID=1738132 RepID=A0AAD7BB07_9AGAR|nr:hypothetical protein FB45DRAFT_841513 [Roridomyces roridus]
MSLNFRDGFAPIVTTSGPGNLHYFSYGSGVSADVPVAGMVSTAKEGDTNFILGFSYNYRDYAFYWDGEGPAFLRRTGQETVFEPVGNSWSNASGLPWGSSEVILGLNVATQAAAAGNNGG